MKIGYLLQAGVPDILHLPFSGAANHVRAICKEWLLMGHTVRVIAFLDGQMLKSDDLQHFEPVGVPILDRGLIKLVERGIRRVQRELQLPYTSLFESVRFAQICRQELAGFDILIERTGWFGLGGRLAAQWLKTPLVLEINGDLLNERKQLGIPAHGMQHQVAFHVMQASVHGASGFVATGDGWRSRFAEQWQVNPDRIKVVENGSAIVDLLAREQLRSFQKDQKSREATELIFTGRFDPWQGIGILLQALALAVRQTDNLHLSIIGSGVGEEEINRMVKDLHLEEYVTFLGWLPVEAVADHLAGADIGVSPYCGRVEFSGLKLLDYKAAGLAIIASGQAGQPQVLRHGQTGWIVPPCNVQALSEAMLCLHQDVRLRKQMGQAARIEAEQFHSWRQTAENLERVFTQVINRESSH